MPDVNLTNCTINHISADMYEEMCLKNDVFLAESTKELFPDKSNHVLLHNCDLPADRFFNCYARVPYVYRLEASFKTDVKELLRKIRNVQFCALVNPKSMMNMAPEELEEMMTQKIGDGVREWTFWGIDSRCDAQKVREMMNGVRSACAANGFEAVFEAIPFNFDELEWSFPKWQGGSAYSIDRAAELPVDVN